MNRHEFTFICMCPKCMKKFKVLEMEQIPGFRDKADLICPYCKHILKSSMEWEYLSNEIE